MRTDGAAKMRAIAEEASALVRKYKGAFSGEHGDGLCRGEWIEWQFGPAINEAFRAIKHQLDPIGLFNPGKIIDPPQDGRWRAVPLRARHGAQALQAHRPHARARLVGLERAGRPRDRGDHRARHRRRRDGRLRQGRGDVQQQRPLPQVRRRHHVPQLPRDARRTAPDPRPRQHAAPGRCRASSGPTPSPARPCTTPWTCASAARAASATAPRAWTWRR